MANLILNCQNVTANINSSVIYLASDISNKFQLNYYFTLLSDSTHQVINKPELMSVLLTEDQDCQLYKIGNY